MTKNPPVYHKNPAFQSPIFENGHSETQQANRKNREPNTHLQVTAERVFSNIK